MVTIFLWIFAFNLGQGTIAHIKIRCRNKLSDTCVIDNILRSSEFESINIVNAMDFQNVSAFTLNHEKFESILLQIPKEIFDYFPVLKNLCLRYASIKTIQLSDWEKAQHLRELDLQDNSISEIKREVFSKVITLDRISIAHNQIASIEDSSFNQLVNLEYLDLINNQLKHVGSKTFAGLPNLRELLLSINLIEAIDEEAFNFPKLTYLTISENKLKSLPDNIFKYVPKLESISLGSNQLIKIGGIFNDLKKLNSLQLYKNPLQNFNLDEIVNFTSLEHLSLSETGFSFPENVSTIRPHITVLKNLKLSKNNLSNANVLSHVERFSNLETLDLQLNNYVKVDNISNIPTMFPNFRHIFMFRNQLSCKWLQETQFDEKFIQMGSDHSLDRNTVRGVACIR